MCTEELTIAFVDSAETSDALQTGTNWQKGLCVGGKVRSHDCFEQTMLQHEQKNRQLEEDEGFVFDCGRTVRIKRLF